MMEKFRDKFPVGEDKQNLMKRTLKGENISGLFRNRAGVLEATMSFGRKK